MSREALARAGCWRTVCTRTSVLPPFKNPSKGTSPFRAYCAVVCSTVFGGIWRFGILSRSASIGRVLTRQKGPVAESVDSTSTHNIHIAPMLSVDNRQPKDALISRAAAHSKLTRIGIRHRERELSTRDSEAPRSHTYTVTHARTVTRTHTHKHTHTP